MCLPHNEITSLINLCVVPMTSHKFDQSTCYVPMKSQVWSISVLCAYYWTKSVWDLTISTLLLDQICVRSDIATFLLNQIWQTSHYFGQTCVRLWERACEYVCREKQHLLTGPNLWLRPYCYVFMLKLQLLMLNSSMHNAYFIQADFVQLYIFFLLLVPGNCFIITTIKSCFFPSPFCCSYMCVIWTREALFLCVCVCVIWTQLFLCVI